MTDMKRITVSFPDHLDEAIQNCRETKQFGNASYSEVVRKLVEIGLSCDCKGKKEIAS